MWLILSLVSSFIFTALNLLTRVLAVKSDHPRAFSFVYNCWGVLFAVLALIISGAHLPDLGALPARQFVYLSLAAVFYALFERSQFVARKHIESSTLVVIFRLTTVTAFVGSLVFFKESVTPFKIIGAALLIGSSLLVTYKNPHIKNGRALGVAVFCAVALGLAWMLDKPASAGLSSSFYSALMWAVPLPTIAIPALTLRQLQTEVRIGGWKIALAAFLNVSGFVLYLKALSLAEASRVIPVTSSSATLVVLAGIFLLNEKTFMIRKLIAGVLMFIGILLLK
ncbi:DMT family transporter [Candidatus Gottesmanbacteria bacterium]|nr:DMT family transporter [Candidatus Gottesmanbacteria bacterium]